MMTRRLVSMVLCLCMVLSLLPTAALAGSESDTPADPTQEREIDAATYSALGLNVNDNTLSGSPYGGGGPGDVVRFGVQNELYTYGVFHQYSQHSSGVTSAKTPGTTLRQTPIDIDPDNDSNSRASIGNSLLWGADRGFSFYKSIGDSNKLLKSAGGTPVNDADKYATVVSFNTDADDGLEQYVARLSYTYDSKAVLSVCKPGTELDSIASIELQNVADIRKEIFNDEVFAALFELDAGDYDGDGSDELAVYYPGAGSSGEDKVKIYEVSSDGTQLTHQQDISVGGTYTFSHDRKVVSLSSGIFLRNGREQLFAAVSTKSDSALYLIEKPENDFYTVETVAPSLGMTYSNVAVGSLQSASASSQLTAVVGGFASNKPAYRLLTPGGNLSAVKAAPQPVDVDDDSAEDQTYTYAVRGFGYHAPIGLACASLEGNLNVSAARDSVLLGMGVYEYAGGELQLKELVVAKDPTYISNDLMESEDDRGQANYLAIEDPGSAYVWSDKVTVGNLNGNDYGAEQFMATVASYNPNPTGAMGSGLYLCTYGYIPDRTHIGTTPAGEKQSFAIANYYTSGYYANHDVLLSGSNYEGRLGTPGNFTFRRTDSFFAHCAPDAVDENVTMRLLNHGKIYTNPQVMAILQSAPYFADIAEAYPDEYPNQAATELGSSTTTGQGESSATSWYAGGYFSASVDFFIAMELEVAAQGGCTEEISNSTEITEELTYQTTAGEDSVVIMAVPYTVYEYELTENGVTSTVIKYYPMPVVKSQITVEQYDAVAAKTAGLEPIRGNILTSTPGDPASYEKWPSGSINVQTVENWQDAIASVTNFNTSVSGEVSENYEKVNTTSWEVNTKFGLGGGMPQASAMVGVVAGGGGDKMESTSSAKGTSFSGTVDNFPGDASEYSFRWQIGRREVTLNGDPVDMVCFKTQNVTSGVGVPRDLSVDSVTEDSITISWESVGGALQYAIDQQTATGNALTIKKVAHNYNDDRQSVTMTGLSANTSYSYSVSAMTTQSQGLSSQPVTATTLAGGGGSFAISKQPSDVSTFPGAEDIRFEAEGNYITSDGKTVLPSYQWYRRPSGAPTWLRAGTGSTLTLRNVDTDADGTEYYCQLYLSDAKYSISTNVVTLTVEKQPSAIAITGPSTEDAINSTLEMEESTQPVTLIKNGREYVKLTGPQYGTDLQPKENSSQFIWRDRRDDYYANNSGTPGAELTEDERYLYVYRSTNPENIKIWSASALQQYTDSIYIIIDGDSDSANDVYVNVSPVYTDGVNTTTLYVPKTMTTATETIMVPAGENTAEVTLTAQITAEHALSYGGVTFLVSSPGQPTLSIPAVVDASGEATAEWTPAAPGMYTVTAQYAGDSRYLLSDSAPKQYVVVSQTDDSKQLTLSAAATMTYGETVTLTPKLYTIEKTDSSVSTTESTPTGVTYTVNGASASTMITGNGFTPNDVGVYTVTAEYREDGVRYSATTTIQVNRAQLRIAANNKSTELPAARPDFTDDDVTIEGLKDGDACALGTHYTLTSAAIDATATTPGDYPIRVALMLDNNGNETEAVKTLRENYNLLVEDATYTLTVQSFPVAGTAGPNGALSITSTAGQEGAAGIEIPSGTSQPKNSKIVFTAVPSAGYRVARWKVGTNYLTGADNNYVTDTTYTINNLSDSVTVSVEFEPIATKLTFSVAGGTGGTLRGNYKTGTGTGVGEVFTSGSNVNYNQPIRLTAAPAEGFSIDYWTVKTGDAAEITVKAADGVSDYTGTTYDLAHMSKDVEVKVYFVADTAPKVTVTLKDNNDAIIPGASVMVNGTALTADDGTFTYSGHTGDNLTIQVTPPDALLIDKWEVGPGQTTGATSNLGKTMTLYNLQGNTDFTVTCTALNEYVVRFGGALIDGIFSTAVGTVTAAKIGTGSILNGNEQLQASTIQFTATPNEGYEIAGWTLNDQTIVGSLTESGGQTYQIPSLSADANLVVTFRAQPEITFTEATNGTLTCQGNSAPNGGEFYVPYGDQTARTFTAAPEKGYEVDQWTVTVDGDASTNPSGIATTGDNQTYTYAPDATGITENVTIAVSFKPIHSVNVAHSVVDTNGVDTEGGKNGKLTVTVARKGMDVYAVNTDEDGDKTVYRGSAVTFTATPDQGHKVGQWFLNGTEVDVGPTLTIKETTEDQTVTVRFDPVGQKITYGFSSDSPHGIGCWLGAQFTPTAGATIDFPADIIPTTSGSLKLTLSNLSAGYEIADWLVNDVPQNRTESEFTYAVTQNVGADIRVKLVRSSYTVDYSAENGTVTAMNSDTPVATGSSVVGDTEITFTAEPKAPTGYTFDGWYVGGVKQEGTEYAPLELEIKANVSVEAKYKLDTVQYAVIYGVIGENGALAVSPTIAASPAQVDADTGLTFTAAPAEDYQVKGWYRDAEAAAQLTGTSAEQETYTISSLTAPASVYVAFEPIPTYTITVNVTGAGNSVTATVNGEAAEIAENGTLSVKRHDKVVLTGVPGENQYLTGWTVGGEPVSNTLTYTIADATASVTVTANFAASTRVTLTANVVDSDGAVTTTGGTLSTQTGYAEPLAPIHPSSGVQLDRGVKVVFTAAPAEGYMVKEWRVHSARQHNLSNTLTIESIAVNTTVTVEYEALALYNIPVSGTGYTVENVVRTPADYGTGTGTGGADQIRKGGTVQFTVTPVAGQTITTLVVNGTNCLTQAATDGPANKLTAVNNNNGSFTITVANVAQNIELSAASSASHIITATAGAGGSISPSGAVNVVDGGTQSFTITANSGYTISDVLVNDVSVGKPTTYTFETVLDAATITARFTLSGGGGGGGGGMAVTPENTIVIVDGEKHRIGTETETDDGIAATADQKQLAERIDKAKEESSVIFPIAEHDRVSASLVIENIEKMAKKDMTLSVSSGGVSYDMPAAAIDTAALMTLLGATDAAKVPVIVTLAQLSSGDVTLDNGTLLMPPVSFTVSASYGGKTVEVEVFTKYVWRVIEIPKEVDAGKITTAVVVENGSQRHVPTEVFQKDGKWYARINSLTNSTYALIHYQAGFADADGKWFESVVTEMASRGVINGKAEGIFDGEATITRAEFAAILVRALGLPENGDGSAFIDVASTAWYYGAVGKAYEYGLVSGRGDGIFDPTASITRQEAMAILYRAAGLTEFDGASGNLAAFPDAAGIPDWALDAVKWNVGSGLVQGDGEGRLSGNKRISRGETATVILRLLQKSELVDIRTRI